ncbi:YdcF family protein [Actinocorallia sp. API 0066]|uniref:YdcF family protein n=1 Tax=Actinocorallia sp. API 0066 TaxID=2896846 RepID=UPI001E606B4D|nr:YdcF family protein [Actinocorallia sp. API 0066]MCD0450589.1 YdcF family protein [Actinocorallia sp. API 0066]
MTGDELARPRSGSVGGIPFVALPPTAVDTPPGDGVIVSFHAFDPPRTEAAMAAALPMTSVPVWRVYLGLRLPGDVADRDYVRLLGSTVERAAGELPEAVAALRGLLGCGDGAIGLVGHGEGALIALLALAERRVAVSAAALVAPVFSPARAVAAREQRLGPHPWTDETRALAARLEVSDRAAEIARQDPRVLLVSGGTDLLVPTSEVMALRDVLADAGVSTVEAATFRMGHALADAPGLEPRPPVAAAVSVDAALTDWFRRHYATTPDHTANALPAGV